MNRYIPLYKPIVLIPSPTVTVDPLCSVPTLTCGMLRIVSWPGWGCFFFFFLYRSGITVITVLTLRDQKYFHFQRTIKVWKIDNVIFLRKSTFIVFYWSLTECTMYVNSRVNWPLVFFPVLYPDQLILWLGTVPLGTKRRRGETSRKWVGFRPSIGVFRLSSLAVLGGNKDRFRPFDRTERVLGSLSETNTYLWV